ncbi:hypothetical protein A2U01_0108946, partial [Trifolium medium]|nr:hypothetical protein [Trifolium medium]
MKNRITLRAAQPTPARRADGRNQPALQLCNCASRHMNVRAAPKTEHQYCGGLN